MVGLRLGCLSHARLTYEAILGGNRCPFAGWIGNRVDAGFERLDANVATLERLLGAPPLAVVPALAEPTASAAAKPAASNVLRNMIVLLVRMWS